MTRYAFPAAALLLVATACSAQQRSDYPQAKGMTDEGPGNAAVPASAERGPQGPQPAGADRPVPKDAPVPTIRDVPATTGRANVTPTPPPGDTETIARFDAPFAMAFLPGGDLLVTEKAGRLKLLQNVRRPNADKAESNVSDVPGVPAVAQGGQGGLLDVAVAPDFATSHTVYLSYAEARPNGSALALARGTLDITNRVCVRAPCFQSASLRQMRVIWRSGSDGPGGQFGASIAFSPDGRYLFLTSGERQRFTPAQDPDQLLGKVVRLTLDGAAAPGNPFAGKGGDTARAMIWTSGHRNPYGLLFTPDGRLWEEEMGPKGGDELNLLEPGRNYGWPIVSNGDNYSGKPIPDQPSRPDLAAPALWWNPSISPGGMAYYAGRMFPKLDGSLLIAALSAEGVAQVRLDGARATPVAFWTMNTRIRDVAVAGDGAIWLLEDGKGDNGGRLMRMTPRR